MWSTCILSYCPCGHVPNMRHCYVSYKINWFQRHTSAPWSARQRAVSGNLPGVGRASSPLFQNPKHYFEGLKLNKVPNEAS
jgi:hypothetical protein